LAFDYLPVDGQTLPGTHHHDLSDVDFVYRDYALGSVLAHQNLVGGEPRQRAHGAARAIYGVNL
jgi:hypothetical protein